MLKKPDALVLSGGGVKGVATLGAVRKLHACGMLSNVRTVVGTSAGALVGALVATRRDLDEAFETMCRHGYRPDFDFDRFAKQFGVDSGAAIDSLVAALLEPVTFAEVKRRHGVRLVVCVTNLSTRSAEYLCHDTHPDMPVALALRMSCSVPLYFGAVQHDNQWYVDGSIVDNFPCEWAANHGATRVLGVSTTTKPGPIQSFEAFVGAMIECVVKSQSSVPADVLDLKVPWISAMNFGASRGELRRLFDAGAEQADLFVKKRS